MTRILLACALMLASRVEPIQIKVSPRILMAGGSFWLTCRVEPDARNRLLEYGVIDFREHSQRDLEGEHAVITHRILIEHVPCYAGPAYCAVRRNDGGVTRAVLDLFIGGC